MAKNKTKTWTRKKLLVFSLLSVVLLLLFVEVIFRVFFYFKYKELNTSVYIQGSPLQEADSAAIYNNTAYYVDYQKLFQYNECGMKAACGDYQMPVKQSNDVWVLLLGGSAMEGMGSNKDGKWLDIANVPDHPYNENIAFYLQDTLQKKYPSKQVKVFNAAVSGYTIHQGFARYKALSKKYNFDWVISMDGVNEPDTLTGNEPEFDYNRKYWSSFPTHYSPLKYIIPVTQHSALFNTLKQELYYLKFNARRNSNIAKQFPERTYWASQPKEPLQFADGDDKVTIAFQKFIREITDFEAGLTRDKKKHLLLVQPYLAFRDSSVLDNEETALNNYFRKEYNKKYRHSFLKKAYDTVDVISASNLCVQNMTSVNTWKGWTLVDYCHFTSMANRRIANELADYIVADGKIKIFIK